MEKIFLIFNNLNLKHYLLIFASFFIPIAPLLILVGAIIFADTLFGILSSRKRGIPITSHRLSRGLFYKMFQYQMIICSIFFLDHYILSEFIQIFFDKIPYIATKLVAVALTINELLSINENVKIVWGIDLIERIGKAVSKLFSLKKEFSKFDE